MAENMDTKNQTLQQQQAAEKQQGEGAVGGAALCKYCHAVLDLSLGFCTECGAKIDGEERICIFCQTATTSEFCPHCGKRVVPYLCPKCENETIFAACEKCGTLLNPELADFLGKEKPEPQVMSKEEARKIEDEFKQQSESPEFQEFKKKLIERQILLEERDYFNKREKRVIEVFGASPFSLELPDPEEETFRMRAYAALEKTVIERQERLLQEEWERLFPEEKKIEGKQNNAIVLKTQAQIEEEQRHADLERRREEMAKRYEQLLAQVEDEVEAHRIAEERRKEEERLRREEEERRRKAEEERLRREQEERLRREEEERRKKAEKERKARERQRLAQQAYENRILGIYYYGNPGTDYESFELRITSKSSAECVHHCQAHGDSYGKFNLEYDGQNLSLSCISLSQKSCPLLHQSLSCFSGAINSTGTIISGYWNGTCVSHYKR